MTDTLYAAIEDAKAYLAGEDQRSVNDVQITDALNQASRAIDAHCGRVFYQELSSTDDPTARVFHPRSDGVVWCDDFWTTTGLVVKYDGGGDATYSTTVTSTNYQLEPLNQTAGGLRGVPYYIVRPVNTSWLNSSDRPSVQVTARWGWQTVPDPVRQSTLHLASALFKMQHAPLGVVGFGDFGPVRAPVNTLRYVETLLDPYVRVDVIPVVA